MKLGVELVPEAQHGSNLRDLLTTVEWDRCKNLVKVRSNCKCEICGSVGPTHPIECREIWRYSLNLNVPEALTKLCTNLFVGHYFKGQTSRKVHEIVPHTKSIFGLTTAGQWNNFGREQQRSILDNVSSLPIAKQTTLYMLLNMPNRSEGTQTLKGLIALCPDCHVSKHYGYAQISGREEVAIRQLKAVNNLDDDSLRAYLSFKFAQWEARNHVNWKLDVSWIASHITLSEKTLSLLNLTPQIKRRLL